MGRTLSLCMIAKNEQGNIGTAIMSAKEICSEVIVVDTGSTDQTIHIAESFGAKVVCQPWTGFSDARNRSIKESTGDWILQLDCDERLTHKSKDIILNFIHKIPESVDAGWLILEDQLDNGTRVLIPMVRLFKRNKWFEGAVHNRLMGVSEAVWTGARISHHRHGGDRERTKQRNEQTGQLLQAESVERKGDLYTMFNVARHHACSNQFVEARTAALATLDEMRRQKCDVQTCYTSMYWTLFVSCHNLMDWWTPEAHLQNIVSRYPRYLDAHFALAMMYAHRGEASHALDHYGRFEKLLPFYAEDKLQYSHEIWSVDLTPAVRQTIHDMLSRTANCFRDVEATNEGTGTQTAPPV